MFEQNEKCSSKTSETLSYVNNGTLCGSPSDLAAALKIISLIIDLFAKYRADL